MDTSMSRAERLAGLVDLAMERKDRRRAKMLRRAQKAEELQESAVRRYVESVRASRFLDSLNLGTPW